MKHNIKVTLILISMFIIAQIIGLVVTSIYNPPQLAQNATTLPYGFSQPEQPSFINLIISFAIAIVLIFFLMKIQAKIFLKIWFFVVVVIALALCLNAFFIKIPYASYLALIIALPLAYIKIFKSNMLFHNLTELLIYPGIAAVFVPVLSLWSVFILLILISAYDLYAVWHSGIMQKMAKFQISQLKIFAGFLIPSITDKVKTQIEKYKSLSAKDKKKYASKFKKIKIGMAMLGGGDVVFPIIVSGVVYLSMGLLPALMIILFSTIALILLLLFSEKGKFYPAMPFISAGCFLGLFFAWLISFI